MPRPSTCGAVWCLEHPKMSDKVRRACAVARAHGYRYIWIDSCCIDKTSSEELSEAINSMFTWYRDASVCYSFLEDVSSGLSPRADLSGFRTSRWFTRGWTLQELIAPRNVIFLSLDWQIIGTKESLADVTESITGIPTAVLVHQTRLREVSVARRMSWASRRITTRVEDEAYSLMGIFDINMPTLYGEGSRAFLRLQEEILKRIPDGSLFAWGPRTANVFAVSPTPPPTYHRSALSQLKDCIRSVCLFFRRGALAHVLPAQPVRRHVDYTLSSASLYTPVTSVSEVSFLAPSVAQFLHSDDVCAMLQDELSFRLELRYARHYPPGYSTSSNGVRTWLPLLSCDSWRFSPETIIRSGNLRTPRRRYLAILACKLSNESLIGVVCYSRWHQEHSFRNIELYSGSIWGDPSEEGFARLVILSPEDLRTIRTEVQWQEVYLNLAYMRNMSSVPPLLDNGTIREHVHLAPWSRDAVLDAGYTLAILRPLPARRERGNTYSLIMFQDTKEYVDIKIESLGVPPHIVENWLKSDPIVCLAERASVAQLHLLAAVEIDRNDNAQCLRSLCDVPEPVTARSVLFRGPSGMMQCVCVTVLHTSNMYLLEINIEK